ncbi:MAG TPA: FHA domain-containing protein, partial [Caldimonas sp.]|nr:FHA domain-containing protein [Caldimonas sp.]
MAAKTSWWLERIAADGSPLAVPVHALPFGIGRDDDNELVLVAPGVSRKHARLTADADRLVLTDLGSVNGSFVNRVRLAAPCALAESDIVHIGSAELRIRRADSGLLDSIPPAEERTVVAGPGHALS